MRVLSSSRCGIVVWTQERLQNSFLKKIFLLEVDLDKEYMKLDVGKVVDHMTWGNCILTDFMKSGDDYSSLVHNIGTETFIGSDKTNQQYLVS